MFRRLLIWILAICSSLPGIIYPIGLNAQSTSPRSNIFFYQLTTAQGLSDNYVYDMCTDKSGNLWIATGDGLNMFNGKTVIKFFVQDYPALKWDHSIQVLCDDFNRIWVLTSDGNATVIDENRKFHRISLQHENKNLPVRWMLKTESYGIILFTKKDFLYVPSSLNISTEDSLTGNKLAKIKVEGFDTLLSARFRNIEPCSGDSYMISFVHGFYKVDFSSKKLERKFELPNSRLITYWKENEFLFYRESDLKIGSLDLLTGMVTHPFDSVKDQHGKTIVTRILKAKVLNKDQLWIATQNQGLFCYNPNSRELVNYSHNAADPSTLVHNSPSEIAFDNTGWVFIGALPSGISYFKQNAVVGQQSVFSDNIGNTYDGPINSLTTRDNDTYFLVAWQKLLKWKRSTNETKFITDFGQISPLEYRDLINVTMDDLGRVWVGSHGRGIYVLNQDGKILKRVLIDSSKGINLPSNVTRHLHFGLDKNMWVSTYKGIYRVNTRNFKVERFEGHPLEKTRESSCIGSLLIDNDNLWIAADDGAYHFKFSSRKLEKLTRNEGLASNGVLCVNKDQLGNIYIGTDNGLNIICKDGRIRTFGVADGLLNKRIEALALDKHNRMWMGNDVGVACFIINDTSIRAFDERYGLSIQGFRINAFHKNSTGELCWGTERGLQYFYPDEMWKQWISLPTTINRVETRDVVSDLTKNAEFNLSSSDNNVTFYFTSIDYSKHLRTFYEYKLEGLDEKWIRVTDQNSVRYSSLPAGNYVFRVRASNDGKSWEGAGNTVTIHIAKAVWRQTWFRLLGIVLVIFLVWYVVNYYRKKQKKQREELETELVINYFASRINSHQNTEDILWDIARNCISRMQFEDCVIYLVDEERNVLVQKAAHGPKMARDFTIYQPIEIPIGNGIVGSVALTGKAELINNTTLDPRYIADDAVRYSELAVPILIDDKVIGVIDSENSKKNFFTQRHLNILSTIAVLCANQIQRAQAEKEKQAARIEALETRQKVTESRLQSLRLQMNPHFLFNALNSIQQMILANEEMVATRYLSRFSKLLRTILVQSDKEKVTLREEIEILRLYVELESVRFKESFEFEIDCDEEIDAEEVKIPTLLVQPFVENAIWHGLMHKEGQRRLVIRFMENEQFIKCVVTDNGIGRAKAFEIKNKTMNGKEHTSKGIQVSMERLKAMKNAAGMEGSLNIQDLTDENGRGCGTTVEINFPI